MRCCHHCGGPITGRGHVGRPWPGRTAAAYCCYGCLSLGEHQQQLAAAPGPSSGWRLDALGIRIGISLIVVAQSMIFGLALNLHDDVPAGVRWAVQSLILCATVLVVILLGGPLFRSAWHALRRGRLTIEALFLLTMAGALGASLQAFVTGRGAIYFEVVAILLVVYTLGKLIGARSRATAMSGARAWAGQLATCRVVDAHERTRVLPVAEVRAGDVVEVNPGETFAVDGVVRSGVGFVSEAAVSGVPFAAVRRPGDRVLAGAASHDARFRIEATANGTDRQIDRLLAAVDDARDRPVSLQATADRVGEWFFPLVVFTALGTFTFWAAFTDAGWDAALFHAMSVLLVACPCVIGLATPIVVWSALGRLAERGVIVRSGDAVERLAEVDRVMFDKTGTLTDDRFTLVDIATAADGEGRAELLGWLSVVQQRSRHPVAKPFAELPPNFPLGEEPRIATLTVIPGCGVEAVLSTHQGVQHTIQIGRPGWIETVARDVGRGGLLQEVRGDGHRVDVALDGELAAVAVVAERLRESTPEALTQFERLGLPVEVLTGDSAGQVAGLKIPARGGLLPDDKRAAVEAATQAGGRPLFVGDGINDASALASAHVGIALASGTDLAVGVADVTLYHGDLRVLPWAVELSREAVRTVRRNLYRALCYNLFGMALAACGLLHPVAAVALMVVSSLSLVISSTRVGVLPDHCRAEPRGGDRGAGRRESTIRTKATVHAVAVALQGFAFLLLIDGLRPLAVAVVVGFAVSGGLMGWLWERCSRIPHALGVGFGMLTLGNLGMLLGWWADNGFVAIQDHGCRHCVEGVRGEFLRAPWMWVGMLAFANAAMRWLPRRPHSHGRHHTRAMYTGGNIGMLAGMVAGGWCAAQIPANAVDLAVASSFAGMTLGMLAGMLLGTWWTERLLSGAAMWHAALRSSRREATNPPT